MLDLIAKAIDKNATDLYLRVGEAPYTRGLDGVRHFDDRVISDDDMTSLLTLATGFGDFKGHDLDAGFGICGRRIRANFYKSLNRISAVLRILPKNAPDICAGYPEILKASALKSQGLVLVVGATSSGKSTTLAAMLEWINLNSFKHIITIEDPVEFVFASKNSIFTQREIGSDCASYDDGLRAALRQSPDVIMVGEIRDVATLKAALNAAETGHLVLASMHASSAVGAVVKAIAMGGAEEAILRASLAENMLAIVYQRLFNGVNGTKEAVFEVLARTNASVNLIREGNTAELSASMQISREAGSVLFDDALSMAIKQGRIREDINKTIF
ncbi:type IV pilus twitching motility protein PilT [Campylobacter sp. 19-13652]|uniref:type IV pilus twitching motility protein PilT n=1 Tax=Campylobacter sp. 19-13652 TaxID=2840180 RepID=UPI001C75A47C|nr:ATPase, T2SS/T4P/T4SS family [Campylobacter sp. 19-13652]BCX79772.1 twitching motility protein PilT [Campylobacter sp. 19-13652]